MKSNKIQRRNKDVYIMSQQEHSSTLVWLHGLGDSGEGWVDVFGTEQNPCPGSMKVVLLTAEEQKVTCNMGMVMNSWYDILSLNFSADQSEPSYDIKSVVKSAERISRVLEEEIDILNGNGSKVFLGGFSQGGIMSLHVGLQFQQRLGGLLCYSGLLFPHIQQLAQSNINTPVQIYHGLQDPMIPWSVANQSYQLFSILSKSNVTITTSPQLSHSIDQKGINTIKNFLNNNITH